MPCKINLSSTHKLAWKDCCAGRKLFTLFIIVEIRCNLISHSITSRWVYGMEEQDEKKTMTKKACKSFSDCRNVYRWKSNRYGKSAAEERKFFSLIKRGTIQRLNVKQMNGEMWVGPGSKQSSWIFLEQNLDRLSHYKSPAIMRTIGHQISCNYSPGSKWEKSRNVPGADFLLL